MISPGTRVVCIDDEWTHVGDVLVEKFPVRDRDYIVAGIHRVGEDEYVILADQDIDPGFYGVEAFRVKDASASPRHEMVPA